MYTFYRHHCKCCNWVFLHTIVNHKHLVQLCNAQYLYALLILLALICTITFVNFLGIILNDDFCIYYCTHYNQRIITICAFKCAMGIDNFLCAIAIDNFCMHYYYWQLLYALLLLTTFIWTIATKDYHILQNNINIISYIDYNNIHKFITAL